MDGNDITGIANVPPTNSTVVNKKYLTDNYFSNSGGDGMFGNLDMNRNIVFNLENDSSLGSAVNREYFHSTFLQKSGGIMSGNIDLNQNDIINIPDAPSSNSSAINKKYVVDNYLPKTISDSINMNNNAILNIANNPSLLPAANNNMFIILFYQN